MSNQIYQKKNSSNQSQIKGKVNNKNLPLSFQAKEDNDSDISKDNSQYKGIPSGKMMANIQKSMKSGNYPFPSTPIQPKLNIKAPDDKYEQEADKVATDVVQRINAPTPPQDNQGNGNNT